MPAERAEPAWAARALDHIFLARPAALVPLWVFYFGGFGLARAMTPAGPRGASPFDLTPGALLGFLALSAALAGGYLLNQVSDRQSDRANRKLFLVSDGLVPLSHVWIELGALWALAAVVSLWLPWSFRVAAALSMLLGVTYSLPPVHAKANFPLDLIWNGIGFGALATAAGWSVARPLGIEVARPALCYAVAVAGIIASTTIPDREGDGASSLRTTAVALGERGASALALALVTVAAAVGVAAHDVPGAAGALLSTPLLVRAHRTGARRDRVAANQVAVAAFAVAMVARSAYPLALLVAAALASRAYYRRRFDVSYPGPGPRGGSGGHALGRLWR